MIHALPGAVFGNALEHINIFEGDLAEMKATFYGQGPFDFSYSRTADGETETRFIEDIKENSYTLTTGREGQYRLLHIKDKYCEYRVNDE